MAPLHVLAQRGGDGGDFEDLQRQYEVEHDAYIDDVAAKIKHANQPRLAHV